MDRDTDRDSDSDKGRDRVRIRLEFLVPWRGPAVPLGGSAFGTCGEGFWWEPAQHFPAD